MNLPCWHLLAWKRVEVTAAQFSKAVRHMRCLGVSIREGESTRTRRLGETLWGVDLHEGTIGIAWEWGEVSEGIVALVDPLTILSNVCLVTDDGVSISSDELILHLNCAVNNLRWQPSVRKTKVCRANGALASEHRAAVLQGFVGA